VGQHTQKHQQVTQEGLAYLLRQDPVLDQGVDVAEITLDDLAQVPNLVHEAEVLELFLQHRGFQLQDALTLKPLNGDLIGGRDSVCINPFHKHEESLAILGRSATEHRILDVLYRRAELTSEVVDPLVHRLNAGTKVLSLKLLATDL
jgi:hypothetical protein